MESSYESNEDYHTWIDHMAIDETGTIKYIFGTTRSNNYPNVGYHVYIFRIAFLSNSNYLDTSSLVVRETDHTDQLDLTYHVTGIKKTLTDSYDKIHMVIFMSGSEKLYYAKMSFTNGVGTTAVLLNNGIVGSIETFFYGETTETVNGETDVYQSYTVGWTDTLTSELGNTISGNNYFGIVIPSHKTKSCI